METKGLKQIGKGAFSTVYKKGTNKVLIKSCDNVKDCMSMGFFPNSRMFPKIKRVGVSDCGQFQFYEEKFYQKTKSLKQDLLPSEYEFYLTLKREGDNVFIRDMFGLIKFFESLPNKYRARKQVLIEAVYGLSNYGTDICFEISPRNVTVQNGKLILLDCFFFFSALDKVRGKKRKNNRNW